MEITKINEYDIDVKSEKKILNLLQECFPDSYTSDRIYYKQIPHFRYLAFDKDILIGHVGLDYRVMNLNGVAIRVLGIVDICIKEEYRGNGLAAKLLQTIEGFSAAHSLDFLLLFTDIEPFYLKNDFISVNNTCKWTKIDEHKTLGIGEEIIKELMIKQTGNKVWKNGYLDMLGYMY
ncbi:GNAT family N-acetyltransferase [Clostridium sp.]|uniref:GNAT family N-acetyltransferase n=1 Tax=Clostridium sp. TaxID=1506 RepID=UPI003D6D5D24